MLSPPTAKVGKTSLIMSLVGEEFPEEVVRFFSPIASMTCQRKMRFTGGCILIK